MRERSRGMKKYIVSESARKNIRWYLTGPERTSHPRWPMSRDRSKACPLTLEEANEFRRVWALLHPTCKVFVEEAKS